MISFSKNMGVGGNRFVSRLSKAGTGKLSPRKYMDPQSPGISAINIATTEGIEINFMKDAYKVNPWIRATVDKIIARVDIVDVYPQPLDLGSDTPKAATNKQKKKIDKIAKLFSRPNDQYESFGSIKRKLLKDILLYDNAGVEIVNKGLEKFELYCNAPGHEIYPFVGKNGAFLNPNKAYVQIRNKKELTSWEVSELMYFVKNVASGSMRGFSPIESIALQITADLYSDKYNIDFFSNNAMPNIAFLFENLGFGRGNAALRRAKQWYLEEHQGKPHQPLFMGAEKGAVKLQQMQMSNRDMEFKEYQMYLLSKIMAVYGMQPFVLGLITDTTGKLNSTEQVNQFKIDAVVPYLNLIIDTFNRVLIQDEANYGYDDIYLIHDDLDLRDMKTTAEMYETYLKNGVITINQVRQELKMAPVPWGDIPYIPVNIAPLGGSAPSRMDQNPAAADVPEDMQYEPPPTPDYGEPNKKSLTKDRVTDTMVKKWAGLKYVRNSLIVDAVTEIIKKRENELLKVYSIPNLNKKNGDEEGQMNTNSIGGLRKIRW